MAASTTLSGVLLKGVAASRPAASAVAGGTIYSATDTGAITQSDGASWTTYATVGSGITNPMTSVGDIIQGTTAGAAARLASPLAGKVLTGAGLTTTLAYAYPPGYEFDYVQITSDANFTATTAATGNTMVTGSSVTYDGTTTVMIEVCSGRVVKGTTFIILDLWEDSTDIARIAVILTAGEPLKVEFRRTPTAGAKVYKVTGYVDGSTGTVYAGAGGVDTQMPAFIRITKV